MIKTSPNLKDIRKFQYMRGKIWESYRLIYKEMRMMMMIMNDLFFYQMNKQIDER